jgi:hypothetical protein
VYGFDVYEVRQGERTPDDPTSTYGVGGDENAHIGLAPEDMGLPAEVDQLTISLHTIVRNAEVWHRFCHT